MVKDIIKNLEKVGNLGIDAGTALGSKRRIFLTNIFTMVGISFTCLYLPWYLVQKEWVIASVALFGMKYAHHLMGYWALLNYWQKLS